MAFILFSASMFFQQIADSGMDAASHLENTPDFGPADTVGGLRYRRQPEMR
jgi:hypothetical protein